MIDFMIKADTLADFDALALAEGWIDAEGNPTEGVDIDRVDFIVETPPTFDGNGDLLTPAVLFPDYYANVRLHGVKFTADTQNEGDKGYERSEFATRFYAGSEQSFGSRPTTSYRLGNVELVDPETVDTPVRIWAGGMNFS
jgi:hypothetical protein